jgi:hypothetical protein
LLLNCRRYSRSCISRNPDRKHVPHCDLGIIGRLTRNGRSPSKSDRVAAVLLMPHDGEVSARLGRHD